MWIVFACGSALFAGITAVLAKEGIRTTDSSVATALRTVIVLAGAWGMVLIVGSQAELAHLDARSTGLLVSAFARTEFQAVQFMPVVIAPQLFLCGLLVSRDQLPRALEVVGDALPMSWAVDAVTELTTASEPSDDFFRYLIYLVCFGLVVLGVAASTVPRKTR